MPDEIDMLRQFRVDTPGPDDAAWERARTAITRARQPASPPPAAAGPGRRRWRRPGPRVAITAAVAVTAGAAAGLLAVTMQAPAVIQPMMTTAWQPARPLPSSAAAVRAPAGTWRLISYLVARGWQENTAGPKPGPLTCPTVTTCYVEGDTATSPRGPADVNSFYVSTDGARTWSVLPVPAHVTFTSALACATRDACAAGALYDGHQPIYLTTTTGGHSWTAWPLPAGTGQVGRLTCVTATYCLGLAAAPGADPSRDYAPFASLVTTTDGGRHWASSAFPAGDAIASMTCPTATECVAAGATGPRQATPLVIVTRDGGATWRRGVIHSPQELPPTVDVTCVDATHCRMLGFNTWNGTVHQHVGSATQTISPVQYSTLESSDDGGANWTVSTFPRSIPYPFLVGLACPTAQTCYATGSDLVLQQVGGSSYGSSAIVAVTHDAGRTWQRVTFPAPAKAPSGISSLSFMVIGQIVCPAADACVAVGVSTEGSTSTAIYTNHG